MAYLTLLDGAKAPAKYPAFIAVLALAALVVGWRHVGFQASDDADYLGGAINWLTHFPYVGTTHWSLRHTITLPIAGVIGIMGLNEVTAVLPTIGYFAGYIAITIWVASRFIGMAPALVAMAIMATMPGSAVVATYINADMAELFYMTAAFWTFVDALSHPRRISSLVLCGVAAALGFMTRETSAAFVVFAGLMFLFHPIMPRKNYLVIALGFLAIMGIEWAYLAAMTGDPFYRFNIDRHHDFIDRAREADRTSRRDGVIDAEGALSVKEVWFNPILNLFISQKYGLLFWLAAPSAVFMLRRKASEPERLPIVPIMLTFAAVWFLFVGYNPKLYYVPRYMLVFAGMMSLVAACGWVELWRARRVVAVLVAAAVIGANLAGLLVENTNPTFAERSLADIAVRNPDARIDTDPTTLRRAAFFFDFRGANYANLYSADPAPNALVFYNRNGIERCSASSPCKTGESAFSPRPGWVEVSRVEPPPGALAKIIGILGIERYLPADLARKLIRPIAPVILYRVPPAAAAEPR